MYVERWLKAPMLMDDGSLAPREKGTPQGSPISPLIANLFLHYTFDNWIAREFPAVPFERFADDSGDPLCQRASSQLCAPGCSLVGWSRSGWSFTRRRPGSCIARTANAGEHTSNVWFTFCGYAFRPRKAKEQESRRETFTGFLPAVSPGKLSEMSRRVASWRLHRRVNLTPDDLATEVNPVIRGWLAYYTAFYPSEVTPLCHRIDLHLVRWAEAEVQTTGVQCSPEHEHGCEGSAQGNPSYSSIGGTVHHPNKTGRHEPYESRGSRADLWGPERADASGYPAPQEG